MHMKKILLIAGVIILLLIAYYIGTQQGLVTLEDGSLSTPETMSDTTAPIPTEQTIKKTETQRTTNVPIALQKVFSNPYATPIGEIKTCTDKGVQYYVSVMNAYDGGWLTYDSKGALVERGDWMNKGNVSLDNCTSIYVREGNIWGKQEINIYNL